MVWIRDSAVNAFGGRFSSEFRRLYDGCISRKELACIEMMGRQTGHAIHAYIDCDPDATLEQIATFAKAMISRQIGAYMTEKELGEDD